MKHVLNYCNDTVKPVKCDLRWAFDKWKRGDYLSGQTLSRCNFVKLKSKNLKEMEHLNKLANDEA